MWSLGAFIGSVSRQMLHKSIGTGTGVSQTVSTPGHKMRIMRQTLGDATEIVPGVYLGSAYNAANRSFLKRMGIGFIVNVACEVPRYHPDLCTYLYEPIWDDDNATLDQEQLQRIFDFIDQARAHKSESGNVLVHCVMGKSRSAAVMAWYVVYKTGYTIEQAVGHLQASGRDLALNVQFLKIPMSCVTLKTETVVEKTNVNFDKVLGAAPQPLCLYTRKIIQTGKPRTKRNVVKSTTH